MHQTLKRLDPNGPHVYGQYTGHLNQQPNGSGGISLPPLNPPSRHDERGFADRGAPPPPPAAMQGVEYGGYGQAR